MPVGPALPVVCVPASLPWVVLVEVVARSSGFMLKWWEWSKMARAVRRLALLK